LALMTKLAGTEFIDGDVVRVMQAYSFHTRCIERSLTVPDMSHPCHHQGKGAAHPY
jgi:hypothetical protein